MKKTLLFVISITAMVLSAAPWWNNQWGSRIKVTVSTDPMNHSTLGLPVHHQLLEFT